MNDSEKKQRAMEVFVKGYQHYRIVMSSWGREGISEAKVWFKEVDAFAKMHLPIKENELLDATRTSEAALLSSRDPVGLARISIEFDDVHTEAHGKLRVLKRFLSANRYLCSCCMPQMNRTEESP